DFRARFGRDPGPFALVGHRAMRSVLRAIDGAAGDPGERRRVVDAFFATRPLAEAASSPFFLARRAGGRTRYEPLD
ncbi:MAG TPA: hypothetical protein VM266_02470, partial [Solirubrobacteraceae bacterium]|nr:hypothetical protein [Solirubrobacteraceae bacterium]